MLSTSGFQKIDMGDWVWRPSCGSLNASSLGLEVLRPGLSLGSWHHPSTERGSRRQVDQVPLLLIARLPGRMRAVKKRAGPKEGDVRTQNRRKRGGGGAKVHLLAQVLAVAQMTFSKSNLSQNQTILSKMLWIPAPACGCDHPHTGFDCG